jgi:P27 family predicted phage terminase small subunit
MGKQLTLKERRADKTKFLRLELKEAGILEDCSEYLIKQLAVALVEEEDLQFQIDAEGIIYETHSRNGSTMKRTNPAYTELKDIRKALLKLLTLTGFTPASRKALGAIGWGDPFD